MQFISTRGEARPHSFIEAVERGLAPDGGLFLPDVLPSIGERLGAWESLSYPALAAEFFSLFGEEISREEWHELAREGYAGFDHELVAPMRALGERVWLLELFHGPTLAFKDFALQLLGRLYGRQVERSGERLAVLGATSGDTGSAAIHGCMGLPGIRIFILYPAGRIAPLQERQMACTGAENVFSIPVPGTFDDAQRVVKAVFGDTAFARSVNLSAVNSINIARVLAQCVYYLWAWFRLPPEARDGVEFVVPTGNFGNVIAGWLAQQMGAFPDATFRVATNQNDILHRFFTTGEYAAGEIRPSHAPSMDIQVASNFERFLFYLLGRDPAQVRGAIGEFQASGRVSFESVPRSSFRASRMDDDGIRETIARVWREHSYLIDPHTACGLGGELAADRPSVVLSTAHPAKFPDVVTAATGVEPGHPSLEKLKDRPLQTFPLPADPEAVKAFIKTQIF